MAGFLLGTGSGLLAGAAVYYTLSTELEKNTLNLRNELRRSAQLVTASFTQQEPAPAFSGPISTYHAPTSFSTTLKQRWNHAIGAAVETVRETDWRVVAENAWEEGRELASRLGNNATAATTGPVPENELAALATSAGPLATQEVADVKKAAKNIADDVKMAELKATTHVDRKPQASQAGIESPKRLV